MEQIFTPTTENDFQVQRFVHCALALDS